MRWPGCAWYKTLGRGYLVAPGGDAFGSLAEFRTVVLRLREVVLELLRQGHVLLQGGQHLVDQGYVFRIGQLRSCAGETVDRHLMVLDHHSDELFVELGALQPAVFLQGSPMLGLRLCVFIASRTASAHGRSCVFAGRAADRT